jgi:hypothetical protein
LEFRTSSFRNGLIGLVAVGVLAVVGIVLVRQLIHGTFSLLAFGFAVALLLDLAVLCMVVYWSVATLSLRYRLDRNGVIITWGASRLVLAMDRIQAIVPASQVDDELGLTAVFQGRAWSGGWAGCPRLADGRVGWLRSNISVACSTVILTPDDAYVVSPQRPGDFIDAWRVRRPLGPTQHWREEEQRTWLLGLPIWNDHLTWGLMGGALVAALVLHGYLAFIYNRLPEALSFHVDLMGQTDRIGQRSEILKLPLIALLMLMLDLVLGFAIYRHERVAAYLVWGGGLVLQLLAWGALYTVTG